MLKSNLYPDGKLEITQLQDYLMDTKQFFEDVAFTIHAEKMLSEKSLDKSKSLSSICEQSKENVSIIKKHLLKIIQKTSP